MARHGLLIESFGQEAMQLPWAGGSAGCFASRARWEATRVTRQGTQQLVDCGGTRRCGGLFAPGEDSGLAGGLECVVHQPRVQLGCSSTDAIVRG